MDRVDFDDVVSDRGELDTFQFLAESKIEALEDTVVRVREFATTRFYDDEISDMERTYSALVTDLITIQGLVDSALKESVNVYKVRING